MPTTARFATLFLLLVFLLCAAGCGQEEGEGPAESAGKKIDSFMQQAGDKAEELQREAGELRREAGERLEEAGERMQEQ